MKAFHTIAVPHRDILEGRLTMDVLPPTCGRYTRGEDQMNIRTLKPSSPRPI
jgi:hypothetical protein